MSTVPSDILTPDQAASYLQVNRETIYRYIREGKLVASRLGRSYRIPRRSLDLLLITNRTRPDITLRDYSEEEIAAFFAQDSLDEQTVAEVARWTTLLEPTGDHEG